MSQWHYWECTSSNCRANDGISGPNSLILCVYECVCVCLHPFKVTPNTIPSIRLTSEGVCVFFYDCVCESGALSVCLCYSESVCWVIIEALCVFPFGPTSLLVPPLRNFVCEYLRIVELQVCDCITLQFASIASLLQEI